MTKPLAAAFLFCIAAAAVVNGQVPETRTVRGGVLNGKAISLPKPEYPEAAKAARVGGLIRVDVLINENGEVSEAVADLYDQHEVRDASGQKLPQAPADPYLREAAEAAARLARFTPTVLSGTPVRVKGSIIYNFVADNSDKPARVGAIYGPLLNGIATSLPQPTYPAAARAVKASGEVSVHVTIDQEGNVTSARATAGHPLLRSAAEAAAREAKFKPSLLAGQPTPNSGVVLYRFAMQE
jgi:TonB family protein